MTHARFTKQLSPVLSLTVDLPIDPAVTAIYGPPGGGKTALLEAFAGFLTPDSGRILIDDAIVFDAAARVNLPPRQRHCGFLFHRDALFPHLSLRQNVAFAAAHFPRLDRHRRVAESLERFDLTGAADLRPALADPAVRLRTAAARALIGEPKLLLADHPAPDEGLLARIRATFTGPIVFVTSDLDLACATATQLVILDHGRVLQSDAPRTVLDAPASIEVAKVLGIPNLFPAVIAALDPGRNSSRLDCGAFTLTTPYLPGHFRGDRVTVVIRPTLLRLHAGDAPAPINSTRTDLVKTTERRDTVRLEFSGGIVAEISRDEFARIRDTRTWQVEFPPESIRIL